ncbi:MSMEG_0570 family nitrogen starvation response protein [Mycobacterium sp. ITM-2016-00317]|uniref:MSMEG_0570 family nitrogen starvation response protein n=1 Tax=Mycobacterium sp. ITM-2016-00317 TaxID=2099694 RepID=UPI000D47B2C1|nr:MSMEG_0570 family nitrogen starvation response protein [Mycobacterium sp. ITM-2016-00317]WNG88611.1 MSMEG_0570 family nitrogen starvation response protein [Mycobacterium sp. ITM-2016-00317]
MPEMTFRVRWPDGVEQRCYSPSLVVHDHFSTDGCYTVAEFVERTDRAMAEAGDRVRAKFGFACTAAAATAEAVSRAAARYPGDAAVRVVEMHPPLEAS